jgi:hypothetical protein
MGGKNKTNPRGIAELFNCYFSKISEKFITQNDNRKMYFQVPQEINSCNENMFTFPVLRAEIEDMVTNSRENVLQTLMKYEIM